MHQRFDRQDKELRQIKGELSQFKHKTRERFDKIEDTLAIIVNHLKK